MEQTPPRQVSRRHFIAGAIAALGALAFGDHLPKESVPLPKTGQEAAARLRQLVAESPDKEDKRFRAAAEVLTLWEVVIDTENQLLQAAHNTGIDAVADRYVDGIVPGDERLFFNTAKPGIEQLSDFLVTSAESVISGHDQIDLDKLTKLINQGSQILDEVNTLPVGIEGREGLVETILSIGQRRPLESVEHWIPDPELMQLATEVFGATTFTGVRVMVGTAEDDGWVGGTFFPTINRLYLQLHDAGDKSRDTSEHEAGHAMDPFVNDKVLEVLLPAELVNLMKYRLIIANVHRGHRTDIIESTREYLSMSVRDDILEYPLSIGIVGYRFPRDFPGGFGLCPFGMNVDIGFFIEANWKEDSDFVQWLGQLVINQPLDQDHPLTLLNNEIQNGRVNLDHFFSLDKTKGEWVDRPTVASRLACLLWVEAIRKKEIIVDQTIIEELRIADGYVDAEMFAQLLILINQDGSIDSDGLADVLKCEPDQVAGTEVYQALADLSQLRGTIVGRIGQHENIE